MNVEIPTGTLRGAVEAPPSKSITHRLLVMGALSGKECNIRNPLFCEDTGLTLQGLKKLGFEIEERENSIQFQGKWKPEKQTIKINVNNSGTSTRFLTAVSSLLPIKCIINGDKRMQQRPMAPLINTLQKLGAKIEHNNGYLPLSITGGDLTGGTIEVDSTQSSQFLSALLLIAPYLKNELRIIVGNFIASKPYSDMTISIMQQFGVKVEENQSYYKIASGQSYSIGELEVEGDFSSVSNFMIGAAITCGEIQISKLFRDSVQGDKKILEILNRIGIPIKFVNNQLVIRGNNPLPIDWEMQSCPDLVPTLAVLALFAKGKSILRNVTNLIYKESDRLNAIIDNIKKMGGEVYLDGNDLIIIPKKLSGSIISTYNDHRIAMSFAMVGLKLPGVVIQNSECVKKSYPEFWDDFNRLINKS